MKVKGKNCITLLMGALLALACQPEAEQYEPVDRGYSSEHVLIEVKLQEQLVSPLFGFGWNVDTAMPEKDSENLKEWSRWFAESGQAWCRACIGYCEWEKENDDEDPWTSPADFKGFRWNKKPEDPFHWQLLHILDVCEANGIDVELSNWCLKLHPWIELEEGPDGLVSKEEIWRKADEFGENVAAMLYYMKTEAQQGKGYDCVKYFSIWNESAPGFVTFDYPGTHNLVLQKIWEHLEYYDEKMGTDVAASLKAFAMEAHPYWRNSRYGHPQTWKEMVGRGVLQYLEEPNGMKGEIVDWPSADEYVDYIAIHDYNSVFDYDVYNPSKRNQGSLSARLLPMVADVVKQIREYDTDGDMEPLLFNELGGHSIGMEESTPDFSHILYVTEALVRSLNLGLQGGSLWNFSAHTFYNAVSFPGSWWGESEPYGVVHPTPENYYPYQLFCKNVRRGDAVLASVLQGGKDPSKRGEGYVVPVSQRVFATVVSDGQTARVVVVNDSYLEKTVTIKGVDTVRNVKKSYVCAENYNGITTEQLDMQIDKDRIPARSIVVYEYSL